LDRNLWELDSIAATLLDDSKYQKTFETFSKEKLTNIEGFDKNAELLKKFYEKRLKSVKTKLNTLRKKAIDAQNKRSDEAKKVIEEYKKLLGKREKYRMETYGFEMTELGWINIDRGTEPKNWEYQNLEVIVKNGGSFDRVHAYVMYTSIKSMYRLNSNDSEIFYVGNENQRQIIMPKNEKAVIISLGYKGEQTFIAVKEFQTGTIKKIDLQLMESSKSNIDSAIAKYEVYKQENQISKDLEYLVKLNKEKVRQEGLKKEWVFLTKLDQAAFPIDSLTIRYNKKYLIDMPVCYPKRKTVQL
jgi:hypothetical protein